MSKMKERRKFKPSTMWALCLGCLLICLGAIYLPAGEIQQQESAYIGIVRMNSIKSASYTGG